MRTELKILLTLAIPAALMLPPLGWAVTRVEIIDNAIPYRDVYWECDTTNINHPEYTMGGCSPCDFAPGWYYGEAYSYGGEDTYGVFLDRIADGDGAGSHYCHYEYWGGTPEWATGIDCSAYASECWEIPRQSTYTLPYWSYAIPHERLQSGDILNIPYSHVRVYDERAIDGRPIVFEASGSAAKVVHRVVDWGSYQPRVKHELWVDPPLVYAQNVGGGQIRLSWAQNTVAPSFTYYRSLDGVTFTDSATTTDTSVVFTDLAPEIVHYFKVSFPETTDAAATSEVAAAKVSAKKASTKNVPAGTKSAKSVDLLMVNGFDRLTDENTFDFIRQHAEAVLNAGYAFDACSNELVARDIVDLNDYQAVIWILGEESTEDETFSETEQLKVESYLENGGQLFVTGAEIGWDLVEEGDEDNDWGNGSSNDTPFYQDYLKATYVGDDAGVYAVSGEAGSIFQGLSGITFDDGTHGTYDVDYPDRINSRGGSTVCLSYDGTSSQAGIQYEGLFGSGSTSGRLVYLGFPFETVYPAASRDSLMARVLQFFALPADTVIQLVVDNVDPGCHAVGSWYQSDWGNNYGDNKLYNNQADTMGSEHVTWSAALPVPGTYAVYFWVNDADYADTARYIIYDLEGPTQIWASQNNVGDGWHHLGQFAFGDSAEVRVTNHYSGGSMVVADAIRLLCLGADQTPPDAVADLRPHLIDQDVQLRWSPVTVDTTGAKEGISHYVVYRSTDAGFGADPSDSLAGVAEPEYRDPGAAGLVGTDYYYIVRAVDYAGLKSEVSAIVGEFDELLESSK
jgi:hypothetical protein